MPLIIIIIIIETEYGGEVRYQHLCLITSHLSLGIRILGETLLFCMVVVAILRWLLIVKVYTGFLVRQFKSRSYPMIQVLALTIDQVNSKRIYQDLKIRVTWSKSSNVWFFFFGKKGENFINRKLYRNYRIGEAQESRSTCAILCK